MYGNPCFCVFAGVASELRVLGFCCRLRLGRHLHHLSPPRDQEQNLHGDQSKFRQDQ